MTPTTIARRLRDATADLAFGEPVAFVYRPLDYAWEVHRRYIARCARPDIECLFVGMNPGPFGMVQTGLPFGEVAAVRDYLGIGGRIGRPAPEHPKRPVLGFECPRSEVSGRRFWGWAAKHWPDPADFFARHFVWNWCPLAFLAASGANLTPDRLAACERAALEAACDEALVAMVRALRPRVVAGIGGFATRCAQRALGDDGPRIGTVLHPSPASPAANRGWEPAFERALATLLDADSSEERSVPSARVLRSPRTRRGSHP
jgi:single-strand selective monofunctional uracil DNA glycosylase